MTGILCIATGQYKHLFEKLHEKIFEHFLPGEEKMIFVFTDDVDFFTTFSNTKAYFAEFHGWPLNSLLRFRYFNRVKDDLQCCDKLIFFNTNMVVLKDIFYSDFFVDENKYDFWAVNHPGWYFRSFMDFPYERNPQSTACINFGQGKHYLQGCLFAGKTQPFLDMCNELDINIIKDLRNHTLAIWFDESHLNKYFIDKKYYLLDSGFAYPEGWNIPFEPKIMQLNKDKLFDKYQVF